MAEFDAPVLRRELPEYVMRSHPVFLAGGVIIGLKVVFFAPDLGLIAAIPICS